MALVLGCGLVVAPAPARGQQPPAPARAAPAAAPAPTPASAASTGPRLVAETPDAMIAVQKARALAATTPAAEADAVAALAVIASLEPRASHGLAERALGEIAAATSLAAEIRGEAAALARSLASDEGTAAGVAHARAAGILTELSILGTFRDTGGGLDAHEGPEGGGRPPGKAPATSAAGAKAGAGAAGGSAAAFGDANTFYSWGTVEVAWRAAPATFAEARGVPLDLFVHPRKESCSIVASKIKLPAARPIVIRLAAAGTARLAFDGVDLGKSDDVHESAKLDRLAAQVDASAGSHLVHAKVCTGALEDSGRVRFRITDPAGAPLALESTADLGAKPGEAIAWGGALKTTRLPTALTRATNNVKAGDALLAAAVIRALAGADDQKSPRAPGQLDAFLQPRDLDAERVAMAAWVTPSGANRSARFYRAHRLATKANDAVTREFVDRRLVEQHLETDMPDWAIASLRGIKLDARKDDDAILLGARALKSLRVDTLSIQAMRDLAAAYRAAPQKVPTALLFEVAALSRPHDIKTWVSATEELVRRGVRGEVLVDAMGTRGKDEVVKAAEDAFAGGMDDADEVLTVARHVTDAGAHDVAARLYRTAARWAPNRAEAWAGLARELAASSKEPKDAQLVLVALRRARELAPGDAKYRAELALRVTGQGGAGKPQAGPQEPRDDERWLTPTATILARRKGVPTGTPDVADRELHWLRAVGMHADNRVSQLIQYAREIVIPPRTQQELFEPIPPEGDLTEILRARVHRKAGGVAFPTEEHNDGARPRIRWPELEAGDTVEVVIRQWTSTAVGGRGDAPFYFMDYAGALASHPLLYNEVVVETLPGHPLYVDVLHDKLAPYKKTETDERGKHVVRMVWDKPLALAEEPLVPQLSEIVPVIVGSTFRTWDDFRKWYAEAVRGFTEPDDEVRRIAAELTKGKNTREEKLRALFEFVADDIRYVNYVSGEWWLPNRPQQLLARREGDCDDKAILLITLLRSVGIEAQEVMVQTRLTGQPSVLLSKNVAVPMFDHGIAFLPGPGGGQYLDATSPQSRLGPIPSMDARAVALRMDTGPAEVVQLPASSPDDHGADVSWTVTLSEGGSGDVVGEERHTGDAAFWLRSNLSQAEARSQYVEDSLVGPWFPTVEVDKAIDFKGDLPGGQAVVKFKAKSRGLARREGKDLVVPLSPSTTFGSVLAPLVDRTLPVQLPAHLAPSHQNRTVRLVAPPGYRWGELPPGGDAAGGAYGKAHLEIARDPRDARALVIKRSVVFDMHLIPVDKYASWRAFVTQVDALMHKEVRLVPAGGDK